MTVGREKKVDLVPLRAGQLHELSRFVCSLASEQSVNTCMLNSPWHLEPLPSVPLPPMCGGGWKRGEHGKILKHCSSSNAGEGGRRGCWPLVAC